VIGMGSRHADPHRFSGNGSHARRRIGATGVVSPDR
jgi:hypothetical protein